MQKIKHDKIEYFALNQRGISAFVFAIFFFDS